VSKKLVSTEPVFHEGERDPMVDYWTAVEEIVEWAGEQHVIVQMPLPFSRAA